MIDASIQRTSCVDFERGALARSVSVDESNCYVASIRLFSSDLKKQ